MAPSVLSFLPTDAREAFPKSPALSQVNFAAALLLTVNLPAVTTCSGWEHKQTQASVGSTS